MYIETERLIIRDFCEADAPTLYDIKYDAQVRYFCPDFLEVEVSLQDAQAYILRMAGADDAEMMKALTSF